MKKITLILFLLLPSLLPGQIPPNTDRARIDLLSRQSRKAEGESKANLLNALALNYAPSSYDSGMKYAREAKTLSEQLNYQKGKAVALFNEGNCHFFSDDLKKAFTTYLQALRLLEHMPACREKGELYFQLGTINDYLRNMEKARNYYYLALKEYLMIADTLAAVKTSCTLSGSYMYDAGVLGIYDTLTEEEMNMSIDSANKYIDEAIYLMTLVSDTVHDKNLYLADLYNYKGLFTKFPSDSFGIRWHRKSNELLEMSEDTVYRLAGMGNNLNNIGACYDELGLEGKGLEYGMAGLKFLEKTDRYDLYSGVLWAVGARNAALGRLTLAIRYCLKAMQYSDTFLVHVKSIAGRYPTPNFRLYTQTQLRFFRIRILTSLTEFYEETGNFRKSLHYRKLLQKERELYAQDALSRQILGMQLNFEDELNRKKMGLLSEENKLNQVKLSRARAVMFGISAVLVIVGLILFLIYQKQKARTRQDALILEQKLLRSQMNPHFLFNSLTSIQNFIITERPEMASIYLARFSKLMRNILDNSTEEFVPLENEICTIENYLELQSIRFAGKFDYRIKVDDNIDIEAVMIPPMMAQPFIENSIEHGIKYLPNPGHIDVRFCGFNHSILFEVEDNGVGREKAREVERDQQAGHRSMATSITRERLVNLNKKLNRKITFNITDLKDEEGKPMGTLVKFTVPII